MLYLAMYLSQALFYFSNCWNFAFRKTLVTCRLFLLLITMSNETVWSEWIFLCNVLLAMYTHDKIYNTVSVSWAITCHHSPVTNNLLLVMCPFWKIYHFMISNVNFVACGQAWTICKYVFKFFSGSQGTFQELKNPMLMPIINCWSMNAQIMLDAFKNVPLFYPKQCTHEKKNTVHGKFIILSTNIYFLTVVFFLCSFDKFYL